MDRPHARFVDAAEIAMLGEAESPVGHAPERHTIGGDRSSSMRVSELTSHHSDPRLPVGGGKRKLSPSGSSSGLSASTLTDRLTMMNIPTQELLGAVYYGWLWKKGSSFKTWKKRFFLLNGCTLTYYTQCCVISSDLMGGGTQCLDLPARGGLRVGGAELCDQTEFGIRVTSSSGRVLYLQAGDHNARLHWAKVLREAPKKKMMESMVRKTLASDLLHPMGSRVGSKGLSGHESSFDETSMSVDSSDDGDSADYEALAVAGDSDKEGTLYVRRSILHAWSKRHVVLNNGHLTVLRRRRPIVPQDKSFEIIAVHPWHNRADALCVRLSKGRELLVRAETAQEAQAWIEALRHSL
jgi:hypothetical protein